MGKKATTRCILASMWNQPEQPMYCSHCVCVCFFYSLYSIDLHHYFCVTEFSSVLQCAICVISMHGENKIRKENIRLIWWFRSVCTCKTDSHELSKSEKVVSSCFLHSNANTHKYTYIFWYAMNIFGWWIRERRWQCALTAMRVHFYVDCILKTMWYTTPECMFLNCSIAPLLHCCNGGWREGRWAGVIKAHKKLYACVDNNFCFFVVCTFGFDTLAGAWLNTEIQS